MGNKKYYVSKDFDIVEACFKKNKNGRSMICLKYNFINHKYLVYNNNYDAVDDYITMNGNRIFRMGRISNQYYKRREFDYISVNMN